jgi:UDP-2,3-diacylglucosamine pyrophosphatase LpxH
VIVVLGDLHLRSDANPNTGADLARLVRSRRGAHLVLAGDVVDLAFEGDGPLAERLDGVAARHAPAIEAIRDHVASGGRATWVAGNHDHEIASPEGRAWAADRLGGLEIRPWFVRIGDVHVEHGHQWDPDNAHVDPSAPGADPLGVLITRRFVSRVRDLAWLSESEKTPIPLFLRAVTKTGLRSPALIVRWFQTALGAVAAAGRSNGHAKAGGEEVTDRIRALHPRPTLTSRRATWDRLYFSRAVSSLAVLTVGALGLADAIPPLPAAGAVGVGLVFAAFASPNRFQGALDVRLRDGAHAIARETGAQIVVLGHEHRVRTGPVYWNAGSFGLPGRGKPRTFLEIEGSEPRVCELPRDGN